MRKRMKVLSVVYLFLCCITAVFGVAWQGVNDRVNNYWDEPINWTYDTLPSATEDAILYNTNPDSGQLPCWVRPGIDAVANQIWLGHNGSSSSLLVEGNLSWDSDGNFVLGFQRTNTMHNRVTINAPGVVSGGGLFMGNDNLDSEHTFTINGGSLDIGPGIIQGFKTPLLNIQINGGHFGYPDNYFQTGTASDNTIININSIDSDVILQTTEIDFLVTNGSLLAQGATVTSENIDTLLDVSDLGDGNSRIMLAGANPGTARAPYPVDEGFTATIGPDLSWGRPIDADDTWTYQVYIDTDSDFTGVTPITVGPFPGSFRCTATNAQIGDLSVGEYYWRVDAIEPGVTTHTGNVWTFSAGAPVLVNPPDGTGSYGLELGMIWDSHDESVNNGLIQKHKIILKNITDGTEGSAVRDAVPAPGEDYENYYLGNLDMWDIVFYNKDYEWQVIELGAGDEILVEGPVWSFNTKYVLQCTGFEVFGDLTKDCKVTLFDLAQLGASWLDCGWQFEGGDVPYPAKNPCNW